MPQQLAYVIITPYSLHKSRTGGILTRLITRTGCELVAARMFAPSAEPVSYTHLRAHETPEHLVCRLLLEKKKKKNNKLHTPH